MTVHNLVDSLSWYIQAFSLNLSDNFHWQKQLYICGYPFKLSESHSVRVFFILPIWPFCRVPVPQTGLVQVWQTLKNVSTIIFTVSQGSVRAYFLSGLLFRYCLRNSYHSCYHFMVHYSLYRLNLSPKYLCYPSDLVNFSLQIPSPTYSYFPIMTSKKNVGHLFTTHVWHLPEIGITLGKLR